MPGRVTAAHRGAVVIRVRPDRGLHLGGYVDLAPTPLPQRLANDLLAVAVPVQFRGVDEVNPARVRMQERADRRRIINLSPLATELPAAEGDLADLPAGGPVTAVPHASDPLVSACDHP